MKRVWLFVFAVLYFALAICCILVTISIAALEGKFDHGCGLFMEVTETKGSRFLYTSSNRNCQYLIWVPAVTFATSLLLVAYHLYPAISREPKYEVWTVVCWVTTMIKGILLFVGACIVSAGFQKSCTEIGKVYQKIKQYVDLSCKDEFKLTKFLDGNPPDLAIYTFLSLAEASCWIAVLISVIFIIITALYLFWKPCRDIMSLRPGS